MNDTMQFIMNNGFSVFVAYYLLTKQSKQTEELKIVIKELSTLIKTIVPSNEGESK